MGWDLLMGLLLLAVGLLLSDVGLSLLVEGLLLPTRHLPADDPL